MASHVLGTKPKFHAHCGSTVPAVPATANSASYSPSVFINGSDMIERLVKPAGVDEQVTRPFDIVAAEASAPPFTAIAPGSGTAGPAPTPDPAPGPPNAAGANAHEPLN